ncbi:MAG: carbamoyl-phosphate synthase large subunit [Gammaproteobacteria bacterium]
MTKRTDIKTILIIGAGPIVIGQACEFDYAGTQACKALKSEGYKVVLINSNPATIMTDTELADATYIEPITIESLTQIIEIEKPQALLPTIGGQTALNCAMELANAGILKKYNVELIGANQDAIELAENRFLFQKKMLKIGLKVPKSLSIQNINEANKALDELKLPIMIRPSFTLGGTGCGIAYTKDEYERLIYKAFKMVPNQSVLLDEALIGWKEFELEVVRDKNDNCIVISGVENIDPLGVHTGDSITVAPIQTLTDKEYQHMRQAAFKILRAVGVDTGGCNVQFAIHPITGEMVVIEMNPRVSRSSALVSKATGFPIASVAAKLAVGYTLDELKNPITGDTLPSSFEPTLDYVAIKLPRFAFEKFPTAPTNRGPQMQSVGEVLAIGTTFAEALHKAMNSLEIKQEGLGNLFKSSDDKTLLTHLIQPSAYQLWAIIEAFRRNITIEKLYEYTLIDIWFLNQIKLLVDMEKALPQEKVTCELIQHYKQFGFTDISLATLINTSVESVAAMRYPQVYHRIDSCAGEFPTSTAYLYSAYDSHCESNPTEKPKILIIGSGPNRIGQGIEFDYCCVQAANAIKEMGYETIMVNCNPETVSTDYDTVDRLYCSPLISEEILEIIKTEGPKGILVQFGGQTPLQLAHSLPSEKVNLLGVDMNSIIKTEDRMSFRDFLNTLSLKQPKNFIIHSTDEINKVVHDLEFPLIVRPSFVIGGAAMRIVTNEKALLTAVEKAFEHSSNHSVLIEEYIHNGIEIDIDALSDGENVFIPGIMEHIEPAGIHSGDSACITPAIHINKQIQEELIRQTKLIVLALNIHGVCNIQFAVKNNEIFIIEVNPRASRTLPFIAKATGLPLVQIATRCILGKSLSSQIPDLSLPLLNYYCVKEAVFPFSKFADVSPLLSPEMKATGEVMGIGSTPEEAFAKAQIAAGNAIPIKGNAWVYSENEFMKNELTKLGFTLNHQEPADLIIAIDIHHTDQNIMDKARFAVDNKICYVTTNEAAYMLFKTIAFLQKNRLNYGRPLQMLYQNIKHILTGEELNTKETLDLLQLALKLKKKRNLNQDKPLQNKHLALLFDKASLRTRFSFTIAMRELGGDVIESLKDTRKNETPEDQAGVLSGYCHAIMMRTDSDETLERLAKASKIPVINGLSDLHHPCQTFADLLTLLETFGDLKGLTLSYVGDGNNILHSLLLLAPSLGVNIHYACPKTREPNHEILKNAMNKLNGQTGKILSFENPLDACKNADAVYTDVWTSMGFENTQAEHLFVGYQVDEKMMGQAKSNAIFMHCLPMERAKEVSASVADSKQSVIYQQSENRLHAQKALLMTVLKN